MNNIVYAGCGENKIKELSATRKYWQVTVCHGSGEITYAKGSVRHCSGDIAVIPPLTAYEHKGNGNGLHAFLEWTALPFKNPSTVKDDINGGIAHALSQAEYYFKQGNDAVLAALGDLIVSYIISVAKSGGYSPVVELVRADINANLSNASYALDSYIRTLPLNYDYVRKLFKSEVGVTPHDYLTATRMQQAALLITGGLSNTYSRYSVGQIAEMCGYAEPLYFSRVFKKYYGVSPSEYAKK
ncbi:MAG: helix-turn-helix transcriptional regulator [Clostridia bacterium]|nr:helix-turn-helix transcriptional regulator [Clostridia bacterium]